jgi:hypothetical protein
VKISVWTSVIWFSFLPISLQAHHSRAEFSGGDLREIEGEVVRVAWRNPHVTFNIKTVLSDGSEEIWELEAGDVATLARRGLDDGYINVGDQITVAGPISTRRDHYLAISHALLSSGVEMIFGNREPRWSDQYMGGGRPAVSASDEIESDSESIFRVWIRMGSTPYEVIDQPPLTSEARAAWQNYDSFQDDPVLNCILPGMPRVITMAGSRPIEFEERGNDILLHSENFNLTRVIHMNVDEVSNDIDSTPLGYSRGQWNGNTLIVTTTHISWPLFELPPLYGIPQSEEMEIIERFTLIDNELVYDFWANDPLNFTQPIEEQNYFVWRWDPQVEIRAHECEIHSRPGSESSYDGDLR